MLLLRVFVESGAGPEIVIDPEFKDRRLLAVGWCRTVAGGAWRVRVRVKVEEAASLEGEWHTAGLRGFGDEKERRIENVGGMAPWLT